MTLSRLSLLALAASLIAAPAAWAAPRPVPPVEAASPVEIPALTACDQPASAKAVADSAADRMDALQKRMMGQSQYSTALTLWRSERLLELKAWTQDDAAAFSRSLMADEAFQQASKDSLAEAMKMMERADAMSKVLEGSDDAAACRAVVETLTASRGLEALVEKQWAIIDARFAAVAKAKGVSLD